MKILLRLSLCLLALLAITTMGAYFYLTSESVQKNFIDKALKENFGDKLSIAYFKAGLSSARANDIVFKNENFILRAKEIAIDYSSPLSLIFKELNIKDIQIKQAKIEILSKDTDYTKNSISQDYSQALPELKIEKLSVKAPEKPSIKSATKAEKPKGVDLNIKSIRGEIALEYEAQKLAFLTLNAQNLQLKSLKDLTNLRLEITAAGGLLRDKIVIKAQVKENDSTRNLDILASHKRQELLKAKIEYSSDYKDLSILSTIKASKEDFTEILLRTVALPVDINCFVDINSKNFFSLANIALNAQAEIGNLNTPIQELNLLKNSNFTLISNIEKTSQSLSLKSLDANLSQNDKTIAQLKLDKALEIKGAKIENKLLENFATLYINYIPHSILNAYLPSCDFSSNKINAHLSLSLDTQNKAINIDSKEEIYLKDLEVLKDESILIPTIFIGANFQSRIDLENNINAKIDLRLIESQNKEIKAKIALEKTATKKTANIAATGDALTLLGKAKVHIDNLEKIKNSMLDLNLDITQEGENIEVDNLNLKMYSGDFTFLKAKLSEKLLLKNYELQNETINAKITANSFPFEPLKTYIKQVDATSVSCDVDIEKTPELINAKGFVSLENLNYNYNSQEVFKALNPKVSFSLSKKGYDVNTKIDKLSVNYKGTEILRGAGEFEANLKAENYIESANAKISLYLPALMKVGALNEYNNIQSAHAEISLDFNGEIISTNTKLSNLRLRDDNGYIALANLNAQANIKAPEKTLKAQVEIASPNGKSDIAFDAKLLNTEITAFLNSKNIIAEDLIFLSKITNKRNENYLERDESIKNTFSQAKKEKLSLEERKERAMQQAMSGRIAPNQTVNSTKNTTQEALPILPKIKTTQNAIWDKGYTLSLESKIENVDFKEKKILSNLKALSTLDAQSIKTQNATFSFYETAKGEASFNLNFIKNSTNCYALDNLNLSIANIDMPKLCKSEGSVFTPIDGLMSFKLKMDSLAPSLENLADNLKGSASLSNEGEGVIRFINQESTLGSATKMASSLLSIASGYLGDKAKELNATNSMIELFKEFKYSKFNIELNRDDSLDIKVDTFEIINEEILIKGEGEITHDANLPLAEQDLNLVATLYTKNPNVADLFKKVNLYQSSSNLENFYQGATFKLYGSLNNMQNNLQELIGSSAANTTTNLIESFLK